MRIRLELQVEFDTPFNVGSGAMGGSVADKPLLRDFQGLPMIPASSLKGRLRHECERLAKALGEKCCHPPAADKMCQGQWPDEFCPVCRLFGSPWHISPLFFSDLKPSEPALLKRGKRSPRSGLRYGVALSRRRRVAEENLLYTVETFGPLTLSGAIEGNASEEGLALLLAGLDSLFALGGGRSGGLGWCRLETRAYRIHDDRSEEEIDLDEAKKSLPGERREEVER